MNSVNLIGRLTKEPTVSYTANQTAIARFPIAIDRGKDKEGKDRGADFINTVCFGKTAEFVEKWLKKGLQVGITGHIQTGSYEKDGRKVYTTDVIADQVTMIEWPKKKNVEKPSPEDPELILDDEIPF